MLPVCCALTSSVTYIFQSNQFIKQHGRSTVTVWPPIPAFGFWSYCYFAVLWSNWGQHSYFPLSSKHSSK